MNGIIIYFGKLLSTSDFEAAWGEDGYYTKNVQKIYDIAKENSTGLDFQIWDDSSTFFEGKSLDFDSFKKQIEKAFHCEVLELINSNHGHYIILPIEN